MARREERFRLAKLGAVSLESLGVPAAKAREIELQAAWLRVAGEALSRRVSSVELRRGVLEIAVDDPRWVAALRPLVGRLVTGLAREAPHLGVRRGRLKVPPR